jgi:NADH-quinone oxidoreductase subunit B
MRLPARPGTVAPVRSVSIPSWVRPTIVDLGCCGTSALQIGIPAYDLPGYDGRAYDLAPEQANVLIVAGRISAAFVPSLRALHDRMAPPQRVIAYGTCAISGVVFDTVPTAQVIPVHINVPGCPPHPDTLYDALARLLRRRPR